MQKVIEKADVLIEALPYIQKFRGEVVVVKFGGTVPGYGSAPGSAAAIVNGAINAVGTAAQPVVFTSLVGAAVNDVVHAGPVDLGVAFHQRFEGNGGQVVSAHTG